MSFIPKSYAFFAQQLCLLRPARRNAADVIHDAVTGKTAVLLGVRKHARNEPRPARMPDHARKLPVGRDPAGRNAPHGRQHTARKFVVRFLHFLTFLTLL